MIAYIKWRHNGRDGASNHQTPDCLLSRLIRRRSKKTSQLRVTGLYAGNSLVTGEFPAQMASNAENVSIWLRHHEKITFGISTSKWQPFCLGLNVSSYHRITIARKQKLRKWHRHDDVIKWKHFPRNWPFVRGIRRSRWIPHTKASDAEFWCFLWSASE